LRVVLAGGQGKVVVLTGATPGVGKSFVAANFGAVLASVGQRVIVIDGDLRRPSLHPHFGVDRSPGLSDVLAGTISFELALHRIESPRLDFLAAGAVTHAPAELLLSSRTAGLIDSLRSAYDYVVIDTPPMLAVDDAAAFAAQSDAVLLVARAGQTRIGELRESGKRLERAGSKPVGVVLNGLSMRSARATYGSYGYTSYAYGSTEAERRPTLCSHLKSWVKQK
jgi:tyrosine-protein kinase Etk/Wzc